MTVSLLSVGNELLRGDIANTNAQWIAAQLTEIGFEVTSIETVGDQHEAIVSTLRRLSEQSRLVFVTGGLGPTSDDVTAAAAAEAVGAELVENEDAIAAIARMVEERGGEIRPGHHKQAKLPRRSEMLANTVGTAPGFMVRTEHARLFFLPGVPHEMRQMFERQVIPRVEGSVTSNCYYLVLHTVGVGESWLAEQLDGLESAHPEVSIGYRARSSGVDIRIESRGSDYARVRERANGVADEVRGRVGNHIYGQNDQTMAQLAGKSVRAKGWRLAVAESCTGGLIAHKLTTQPASDYLVGGVVSYANTAKKGLLGVSEDTLRGHGAVSAEVAAEMAEGARRAFDCDVAISVTGIAGPSGGSAEKPVGLCYWAVAHPAGTVVEQDVFKGRRTRVQKQAAHAALDLLRRTLNGGS